MKKHEIINFNGIKIFLISKPGIIGNRKNPKFFCRGVDDNNNLWDLEWTPNIKFEKASVKNLNNLENHIDWNNPTYAKKY